MAQNQNPVIPIPATQQPITLYLPTGVCGANNALPTQVVGLGPDIFSFVASAIPSSIPRTPGASLVSTLFSAPIPVVTRNAGYGALLDICGGVPLPGAIQMGISSSVPGAALESSPASQSSGGPTPAPGIANGSASLNGTTSGGNNTSLHTPAASSTGLKGGAVAGVAIGILIVGIALGALAMFLLCGRRNRKRGASGSDASTPIYMGAYAGEKQHAGESLSLPLDSAAAVIERNMGDPVSDKDLTDEYTKIDQKINNHVVSFYSKGQVPTDGAAAQTISNLLGSGSGFSGATVTALLANPQTRLILLRYAIARTLISRMDFESAPESSLLPAGVANSISGMPKVQHNDPVRMAFLTKWRSITSYLMGKSSSSSEESIRRAVLDCNSIVGPYASSTAPEDQQERLGNLEQIIRRAGRVSGLLFSQAAFWKFDWQQIGPGVVVFPGLTKVTDENGLLLQPPVVYEQKNVVQV